jgi:hypothetical protein
LRRFQKLLLIVVLAFPSVASAQTASQVAATLQVTGPAGQTIALNARDLDAMPRETVNVTDEKGSQIAYGGVPVNEILRRVGTPSGKDIRGKSLTLYLLVSASDGYHAVFALAELDPIFSNRHILLVDLRDGKPLAANEGPFRIVVPDEKRHARWVRNVTSLTVKNAG